MKKHRLINVFLMVIATTMVNISCNNLEDDDPGLIVTVADFSLTLEEGTIEDEDVLGQVPGTSNQGSVNFEITSQTPTGALKINAINGELTVTDASQFVANEQVTGVVTITKDDIIKTANLKIDVIPPVFITCDRDAPIDFDIDLSAFIGDLVISNINTEDGSLIDEVQGYGDASNACGIVEVTGDIIGGFCDVVNVTTINLVPTDATTGTFVIEENTPYLCFDPDPESGNTIQATGTYDLTTSTITIDYTWFQVFYDAQGQVVEDEIYEIDSGRVIITPGIADPDAGDPQDNGGGNDYEIIIDDPAECAGAVDTSAWEGDLIFTEDFGGDSYEYEVTGVAGDTCTLAFNGDFIGIDCISDYVIHFIPDSEGATTGAIIADEQLYDCDEEDGSVSSVIMTGTYDLTTSELILDYQYLDGGEESFSGQLIVTLAP